MPPSATDSQDALRDTVEQIARHASESSLTIACAESLTAGGIAQALARGSDAASWFAGGVVSYMSEVKFDVLGVTEGPVVTASCAEEMVAGVTALMHADAAVAVTGVGGPTEEEGEPAGTVFIATRAGDRTEVSRHQFEGDPPDVLDQTVRTAVTQLLRRLVPDGGPTPRVPPTHSTGTQEEAR
jgi:nicotinamide-nucleotide amidase